MTAPDAKNRLLKQHTQTLTPKKPGKPAVTVKVDESARLREIVELKDRFGAWLLIDEAHATGLYGPSGAGLIAEAGLSDRVEIIMGTLSKALGSIGGYIAGSRTLIDWLINRARRRASITAGGE